MKSDAPYWKTIPLERMDDAQWEDLCDGCGKCCLLKLEDEDTGDIAYTRLHCRLLDAETCRCSDYDNRKQHVPECVKLSPQNVSALKWMPKSCAYRVIADGGDLPEWHHLISGDRQAVHRVGASIMGRTVCEDTVLEDDQIDWIVDWNGDPP
ncbi:MAG: YcgN family cysteine cluster protein [Pseudomonadota bacterium]